MQREEITTEHTYGRIAQLLEDLEALRLEMGRSRDARVPMNVRDAAPREVIYHACTVHRKANRLCVELDVAPVAEPLPPQPARATSADVLRVLDSARERIATARASLRIEGDSPGPAPTEPPPPETPKDDSDVLGGCLLASRQLNVMIGHAFTSGDAYEQLVRALELAARLLDSFGVAMPPEPPFERRRAPRDVFQVLWQCCEMFYSVLVRSGIRSVVIERGYVGEQPTDVHDLATVIVSELEYVASMLPGETTRPLALARPAPIVLPVHNFRRARQLRAALVLLADQVKQRSDWLAKA